MVQNLGGTSTGKSAVRIAEEIAFSPLSLPLVGGGASLVGIASTSGYEGNDLMRIEYL